jgi:hypothetical protein
MKRIFNVALMTGCCALVLPTANAQTQQAIAQSNQQTPITNSQAKPTSTSSSQGLTGAAAIPKKMLGFVFGAAVGTPVNVVRRTVWEEKQGVRGIVGDHNNKAAVVSAGAFWAPFSVFLGTCEAPFFGPVNSLKNVNKPFSKEQMSLGEQNNATNGDAGANNTAPGNK